MVGLLLRIAGLKQISHVVEQLHFSVAPLQLSHQRHQLVIGLADEFLRVFAIGDVAYVALNDLMAVFPIDVADKLDFSGLPDITFPLQFSKGVLAGLGIREQPDFPELLPDEFVAREP